MMKIRTCFILMQVCTREEKFHAYIESKRTRNRNSIIYSYGKYSPEDESAIDERRKILISISFPKISIHLWWQQYGNCSKSENKVQVEIKLLLACNDSHYGSLQNLWNMIGIWCFSCNETREILLPRGIKDFIRFLFMAL